MKKFLIIGFFALATIISMTLCVSAETVFETEKLIKCEDVYSSSLLPTTYAKSFGDRVYFTSGNVVTDSTLITEPDLYFKFNVPQDGNYTMYLHGAFPTGGSDSFFFKFDNDEWKDIHPQSKGNMLYWTVVTTNHYFTAGEHTFYLHHREVGAVFDCFSIIRSDGDFKIIVEGATLESDVAPYIENGVSMVPFRALAEALGAEVTWNGEERSATIKTPKVSLTVVENSGEAYFGNFPIKLESPARIINGRFMVPVRFVAGNLQYEVNWISYTNHAFIEKK